METELAAVSVEVTSCEMPEKGVANFRFANLPNHIIDAVMVDVDS